MKISADNIQLTNQLYTNNNNTTNNKIDSDFGKRSLAIKLTIRTTTMIDILWAFRLYNDDIPVKTCKIVTIWLVTILHVLTGMSSL